MAREKAGARKKLRAKRSANEDPRIKLLVECAKNGWIDRLEKLLESDQCPPQPAIDRAYLHAAEHGQLDVVKLLLPHISDKSLTNNDGCPAVVLSARRGHVVVTRFLLEIGISIETANSNGDTPLLAAIETSQELMVKWLLNHGANPNAKDEEHNSALHIAAFTGNVSIIRTLLEAGANKYVLNDDAETPVEVSKTDETVREILEFGVPKEYRKDHYGDASPLSRRLPDEYNNLFWPALGVGRDSFMFQSYPVFPFDRLNDTERIVLLEQVAEAVSGYNNKRKANELRESTLFSVFAMVKARIKQEIEACEADEFFKDSYDWRKRTLDTFERLFGISATESGIPIDCMKLAIWSSVVNMIASRIFGRDAWRKLELFHCPYPSERQSLAQSMNLPKNYFAYTLPSPTDLSPAAVQMTFKKLVAISKTHPCTEKDTNCLCESCVAEQKMPLQAKLSALDESKPKPAVETPPQNDAKARDTILHNRKELTNFWSSLPTDEMWFLTEMTIQELQDLIYNSKDWEMLRAAYMSYVKFTWDDDKLEMSEDCVTIMEEVGGAKQSDRVLDIIFDAVVSPPIPAPNPISLHNCKNSLLSMQKASRGLFGDPALGNLGDLDSASFDLARLNEEEWEMRGRMMLENLVLSQFGLNIAATYLSRQETAQAQRAALELELELLQEEKKQTKNAAKKAKKRKAKKKNKKKAQHDLEPSASEHDSDIPDEQPESPISREEETTVNPYLSIKNAKGLRNIRDDLSNIAIIESEQMSEPASDDGSFSDAPSDDAAEYSSGMMFICTGDTYKECMDMGIFGLPRQHLKTIKELAPRKSALFLFNINSRTLHGLYEPSGKGGENLNPNAWSRHPGKKGSPYPAQIPFKQVRPLNPLPEGSFGHLFTDGNRIRKLTAENVASLLDLFETAPHVQKPPAPKTNVTPLVQAKKYAQSQPVSRKTTPSRKPKQSFAPSKSESTPQQAKAGDLQPLHLYCENETIRSQTHPILSLSTAAETCVHEEPVSLLRSDADPILPRSTESPIRLSKPLTLFGGWDGIWQSKKERTWSEDRAEPGFSSLTWNPSPGPVHE